MGRMTENEARDILEVGPYATPKDVKAAYKRLALDCNPDYNEATPESARQFRRINAAYDRLTKDNVDDEDIDRGTYVDGRRFGIFRGVVISDRHVTRVHTDDGFFFVLGPTGLYGHLTDSDDEFDSSQYSFKLTDGKADEQAKTKAEKNKLKKKRKKENKKQARENFLKEREEIKNERQKTVEESKASQKRKTDTGNPNTLAICYGETNEGEQSLRNNSKKVSEQKKEQTKSNAGNSKVNVPQKLKNTTKLQKGENQASNSKKVVKAPTSPSKPAEVPSTKQKVRSTGKEMPEKPPQENEKIDAEELDVDCAFFAKVAQKRKPAASGGTKPKTKQSDNSSKYSSYPQMKQKNEENMNHLPPSPAQVQAQKTATEGNKMASEEKFDEAIKLYSQSHLLNPTDYRLLGNRSFCFEKLKDFERALADAEKCISLSPTWSKGYFRKGRALLGMKRLAEAEKAFEHVLKIDKYCHDAESELNDVRVKRLQEMGFSKQQSLLAVKKYCTVDQAVDAMLSGAIPNLAVEDVYVSDEDDVCDDSNSSEPHALQPRLGMGQSKSSQSISGVNNSSSYTKTNHNFSHSNQYASHNSEYFKNIPPRLANMKPVVTHDSSTHGTSDDYNARKRVHSGIYVGSLKPQVKEESLKKYFGKFGPIQNIQRSSRGHYGYVNYFDIDSARLALEAAEFVTIDGVSLNLDYPGDRANLSGDKSKSNTAANYQQSGRKECFNWRGSGCRFGPDCRYLHVPDHQGIDMR